MNRKNLAAILFNPFSIILLGGLVGLIDNTMHFFFGKTGDVVFGLLFAGVAVMLMPLAREYFAQEKAMAALKKKRNLGIAEWCAILPAGVMLAVGLNRLWTLAVLKFGPNGNLLFLTAFAAYIGLLLFLDLKKRESEHAALRALPQ
ncbi:hypothetical protein AB4Y45_33585 [Paraburkholderia sp. EG287A]|uniref:hypothetical protein n=1 Tax=Paraburkholderia sp. EG287A TaxID=3237012 RepID=UPI0034D2A8BB